jgi:type IV pilus assembly protein PilN
MIKINLLQGRKEKKKIGVRKEIIVLILSLGPLVLSLILVQLWINHSNKKLEEQISTTRKDITYYKSLTTEVNKAKEEQKILLERLNIITTLRKQKAVPAKVLDELCINKPEKVYFESVKKDGSRLAIDGVAMDDETIANFMTNLRKSKMFKNVDLIVSERTEVSKIKLKKFSLSCEIIFI